RRPPWSWIGCARKRTARARRARKRSKKRKPGRPARRLPRSGFGTLKPGSIRSRPLDLVEPQAARLGRVSLGPGRIDTWVRQTRAPHCGRLPRGLLHGTGIQEAEPRAESGILRRAGETGLHLQGRAFGPSRGDGSVQSPLAAVA